MHTYVDFLTHIKGVEYLISVVTIAGFILVNEVLKPAPFRSLARTTREDLDHLRAAGARSVLSTVGRMLWAPFIGLAYVIALPFICAWAAASVLFERAAEAAARVMDAAGATAVFGWRPNEAYLGGRKDRAAGGGKKEGPKEKDDPETKNDPAPDGEGRTGDA